MDRRIALIVCFGFGVVMIAQYFSNHPLAREVYQSILNWWQIVFAFALILGIVGYIRNNVSQIKSGGDRPYRLLSLIGFAAMPLLALGWGIGIESPFMWMFENVQAPMQSTVFALLAFFVASASYRGFRARSATAMVLLLTAVIILVGRSAAVGDLSDWLPGVGEWIRNYPSMAARRAILLGIGLGSLTTSLRVILGIERTWLGAGR